MDMLRHKRRGRESLLAEKIFLFSKKSVRFFFAICKFSCSLLGYVEAGHLVRDSMHTLPEEYHSFWGTLY